MARNPKPAAEKAEKPEAEKEAPAPDAPSDTGIIEGAEQIATVPAGETPAGDVSADGIEHASGAPVEDAQASAGVPEAVEQQTGNVPFMPEATDLELVTPQMVAVITATVPSRRRAGRSFGPTPTRIAVDQLTDEDFDALADDPVLKIHMEPAEEPTGE